jgi:hypothetical protein
MSKMLPTLVAVMTLTATAATAGAESYDATQAVKPSQGYLGVGATIGAQRAIVGGMYIDGGKRIGDSPLFVHGQMTGQERQRRLVRAAAGGRRSARLRICGAGMCVRRCGHRLPARPYDRRGLVRQ